MAEWREVAKAAILADGHVSEKEVDLLREHVFEDGIVSKSELDFIKEIKAKAKTAVKSLDVLISDCEAAFAKSKQ
ncbi:hypothetical protein TI04_04165 [Achromatium sp. WMS2]|nr:hypothetical protein TI04_04165 [Achromatium sp. WMS2]